MKIAGGSPVQTRRLSVAHVAWAVAVVPGLLGQGLIAPARAAAPPSAPAAGAPAAGATAPGAQPPPALQGAPSAVMAQIIAILDKNADHVAVRVGDIPITQGDAAEYVRTMPIAMARLGFEGVFRQAMESLIRQKMLVLKAKADGLDKDPAVLRKTQIVAEKVMVDEWLDRKATAAVTDEALHARYNKYVAGKPGPAEVRARVILVPTEAEALDIISKAQQGADFADLARQYSKEPNAAQGGDLGYVTIDDLSPELGSVLFSLGVGQMTQYPVSVPGGYFIARIEERRQRPTLTFDQARPVLVSVEKANAVRSIVLKLADEITVVKPPDAPAAAEAPKK